MDFWDFIDEVVDAAVGAAKAIWEAVKAVWNWIKNKIVTVILIFKELILDFFRAILAEDAEVREKIKQQEYLAMALKQRLDNGDYVVVEGLFDKEKEELVEPEKYWQVIKAEDLDQRTKDAFADKDMLVLK